MTLPNCCWQFTSNLFKGLIMESACIPTYTCPRENGWPQKPESASVLVQCRICLPRPDGLTMLYQLIQVDITVWIAHLKVSRVNKRMNGHNGWAVLVLLARVELTRVLSIVVFGDGGSKWWLWVGFVDDILTWQQMAEKFTLNLNNNIAKRVLINRI